MNDAGFHVVVILRSLVIIQIFSLFSCWLFETLLVIALADSMETADLFAPFRTGSNADFNRLIKRLSIILSNLTRNLCFI